MPIRRISLAALLLLAALAALAQRTPGPTPLPRPTPRPLPTPAPTPLISRPERWPMPRPTEAGPLGRLNTPDEQKRLRLTDAVWQGAQGQVAALLEVGADPNVGAAEAGFPLMLAAYRGDIALATLLLDKGAVPVMPRGGNRRG